MSKLIVPGKHFNVLLSSQNTTTGITPVYQVVEIATESTVRHYFAETIFGRSQAQKYAIALDSLQDVFEVIQKDETKEYYPIIDRDERQKGPEIMFKIIERRTGQVMHESFPVFNFVVWYVHVLGILEARRANRMNSGAGFIP